jgi:formyl-CoA transferase
VFACADGFLYAGVLLDSHWKLLAPILGRPELADDPRYATIPERVKRRTEVNRMLGEWVASRPVAEVVATLSGAGLAAAKVQSYRDAAADPHVRSRDMLQVVEQQGGEPAPITGPAAKLSRTPTRVRSSAASLGQHTREVLRELGLEASEVEGLLARGVIA